METAQQDVGARTYEPPPELNINTDKIVSALEQQQEYKQENIDTIFEQLDAEMWKKFGLDVANDVIFAGLGFGIGAVADGLMNHNLHRPVKAFKYDDKLTPDKNIEEFNKLFTKQQQYLSDEMDKIMYKGFTNDLNKNQIQKDKIKNISKKEYEDRLINIGAQQSIMNESKQSLIEGLGKKLSKKQEEILELNNINLNTLIKQLTESEAAIGDINVQLKEINDKIIADNKRKKERYKDIDGLYKEIEDMKKTAQLMKQDLQEQQVNVQQGIREHNKIIDQNNQKIEEAKLKIDNAEKNDKRLQDAKEQKEQLLHTVEQQYETVSTQYSEKLNKYTENMRKLLKQNKVPDVPDTLLQFDNYEQLLQDPIIKTFAKPDTLDAMDNLYLKYKEGQYRVLKGIDAVKEDQAKVKKRLDRNKEEVNHLNNAIENGEKIIEENNQIKDNAVANNSQQIKERDRKQKQYDDLQQQILEAEKELNTKIAPINEEINKIDEELKDLQKREFDNNAEQLKLQSKRDLYDAQIKRIKEVQRGTDLRDMQQTIKNFGKNSRQFTSADTQLQYDGTVLEEKPQGIIKESVQKLSEDNINKLIKQLGPSAQKGAAEGAKFNQRTYERLKQEGKKMHRDQYTHRQYQMEDIYKSAYEFQKDTENIIAQYNKILKDLDKAFDIRNLPQPKDYINKKGNINANQFKRDFNDYYNYKMSYYPRYDKKRYNKLNEVVDATIEKPVSDVIAEQRQALEQDIDTALQHRRAKRINTEQATQADKDFYTKYSTPWKLDNIHNTLNHSNVADITKKDQLIGDIKPPTDDFKGVTLIQQYNKANEQQREIVDKFFKDLAEEFAKDPGARETRYIY